MAWHLAILEKAIKKYLRFNKVIKTKFIFILELNNPDKSYKLKLVTQSFHDDRDWSPQQADIETVLKHFENLFLCKYELVVVNFKMRKQENIRMQSNFVQSVQCEHRNCPELVVSAAQMRLEDERVELQKLNLLQL